MNRLDEITGPIDEAVEILRVASEASVLDADDLIAKLLRAKSHAERAGTALHLAEQFVRIAEPARIDSGVAVVGRDLVDAIRRAKGLPSVRAHYEAMAAEASGQQPAAAEHDVMERFGRVERHMTSLRAALSEWKESADRWRAEAEHLGAHIASTSARHTVAQLKGIQQVAA